MMNKSEKLCLCQKSSMKLKDISTLFE